MKKKIAVIIAVLGSLGVLAYFFKKEIDSVAGLFADDEFEDEDF